MLINPYREDSTPYSEIQRKRRLKEVAGYQKEQQTYAKLKAKRKSKNKHK
jgi:hypothetical protein